MIKKNSFITVEGHRLFIAPDPLGVRLAVVPAKPPLEDHIVDVFTLGINFSNMVRALREMETPKGFCGENWDSSIRKQDGKIALRFAYKHDPTKTFETWIAESDSKEITQILEDCIHGRAYIESGDEYPGITQGSKIGRNDPCHCGSGKKYKKCCGLIQSKSAGAMLPTSDLSELEIYRDVKDQTALAVLGHARLHPHLLKDANFWSELGCALGASYETPLALAALKKSLEIEPENNRFRANYAATLGVAGRNEEALQILEKLPNKTGEFSVLMGNQLASLDRNLDAIAHYERAIEYDPSFSFSYTQMLSLLEATEHPLYEYWLERSRRQFPSSPPIACAYARWLIAQNRLEELAGATWIGNLEHIPDNRVMGRNRENPRLIVEVRVLGMIATSLATDSVTALENALKVLEAASDEWHLCVPAEQIALTARYFGRRDLVWGASRRFCAKCTANRLGRVTLQTFLAQASATAGQWDMVVKDAEIGLAENSKELALKAIYWWALDEVGRSGDALRIAKEVQTEMPSLPNLCYNIGYIAGKLGQPATAIRYYEREIQNHPECGMAYENLALIKLMEGNLNAARDIIEHWQGHAAGYLNHDLFAAKKEKFLELSAFVEAPSTDRTIALDVKTRNESSAPFFGAETKIPEGRPTREEIVAALTGSDPDKQHEVGYLLEMEQRGDYSSLVAKLEREELPGLRNLPESAFVSILEAESQINEPTRLDFAPCSMAFCKSVEILLYCKVFKEFRGFIKSHSMFETIAEQSDDSGFEKALSFTKFILKGTPVELGTMAFTLNLCRGKTASSMKLLSAFRDWLTANDFVDLIQPCVADSIGGLAKGYRNPAAHSETHSRETAQEARRQSISILNKILSSSCS
jgi:tetratricopeptide (TPR) repeat protein